MAYRPRCPVVYIGDDPESEEALALLHAAGFDCEVKKVAPSHPRALYGTPVLFGLSNRFEGVQGVRVFIANATLLGYRRQPATAAPAKTRL